jgi:hypothetical protein
MRIAENKQNQWLDISRRVRRPPCWRPSATKRIGFARTAVVPKPEASTMGLSMARSRDPEDGGLEANAPLAHPTSRAPATPSHDVPSERRVRAPAHEAASDRRGCRMRPRPSSSLWLKLNDCSCSRYLRTLRISRSMLLNCERRPHKAAVVSAMAGSVFNPECMHV